jgi:hypothetical protein
VEGVEQRHRETMMKLTCETCGNEMRCYCPRCIGAKGGSRRTPAQQKQAKKALKLAIKARRDGKR